jgi:hypothetical protein
MSSTECSSLPPPLPGQGNSRGEGRQTLIGRPPYATSLVVTESAAG